MAYLEYVEWNLQNIINDKSISAEEKSTVIYNSSKHLFTKLFRNRESRPFFARKNHQPSGGYYHFG